MASSEPLQLISNQIIKREELRCFQNTDLKEKLYVYTRPIQKNWNHCYCNENGFCDIDVTWQPRKVHWNAHV